VEGVSTVVHAGVRDQAAVDAGARKPVVLVAQRLESEKRTALALDAFRASRLAERGWKLVIAGGGSLREQLERQAHRLRIARSTRFLGHVSDVARLMATAGVLLAPRPDEAYGLSVVEAMAAGLPVVAAAGGGHLETVGTVPRAALFPPGDVPAAGAMLAELAADDNTRASYGEDLRNVQRTRFTLGAQERATDAVYRSLV
jgi:glycosyltransferase involved in cell wall biosynthesis